MILTFRHKGLQRFFLAGNTCGIQPQHAKRLRLILSRLNASEAPRDMALPGLRMHPLKAGLQDYYAVDVSGNWRVIFRFEGKDAYDVNYLDYH